MEEQLRFLQAQTPCTFGSLKAKAHEQYPALKSFCEANAEKVKLKPTDKGLAGKLTEFWLFGRLPNNDSEADLGDLGDLKVTHVKSYRALGYNAMNRLTITNCGSTHDYSTLQHLVDADCLAKNRLYKKLQKGVIVVLQHHGERWTTLEQCLKTEVVAIFQYDIETLPEDMRKTLAEDYAKIQERVRTQTVSQKGQVFLHIHPHASKGAKTRALGFTNKFLTTLIAHYTNQPLVTKGNSCFIQTGQSLRV